MRTEIKSETGNKLYFPTEAKQLEEEVKFKAGGMSADSEEQEDELLALHSIFDPEEFVRDETKSAGEIRACVELPDDFTVALKEGDSLRQYVMSFLPPLILTFELPEDYPSSSPPSFTLTCSWLTDTQLSALAAHLTDLYRATGGAVVLFTWVQFLKENALEFLDIHTLLELPSDEHKTGDESQDSPNAAEPSDNQSCNVSDPSEEDISAPSLEAEHPAAILTDGQSPSTSDLSSTDSQGAVASDHSKNDSNSGPNTDYQKSSNNSDQTAQASDVREAEQILHTSESQAVDQDDLSSVAGKSKPLPVVKADQNGQEDFLNEGSVSVSVPSSSSGPLDQSEHGASSLPVHPGESPPNKDRTPSRLCLTPSQTLLSQLLIYNATQQQKQFATTVIHCGVCFTPWLVSDCVQLPECGHIFCQACLGQFCKLQIAEGNVQGVTCPQADCTATPTPAQVRSLVGEELFSRYDRLLLQNTLDGMPDIVYCPRRSCGSAVIQEKSSKAAMCSVCSYAFCVVCKKTYHGEEDCQQKKKITERIDTEGGGADLPQSQEGIQALWDDYASGSKERQKLLESRYGRNTMQVTVSDCLSEDWKTFNSKTCPHCFSRIQKNGGCNMMTCSRCRQMFCWVCVSRLPSVRAGSHFQEGTCNQYS